MLVVTTEPVAGQRVRQSLSRCPGVVMASPKAGQQMSGLGGNVMGCADQHQLHIV
jgi:hypothetical protein